MATSAVDRLLRAVSLALEREEHLRNARDRDPVATLAERERLLHATRHALEALSRGRLNLASAALMVERELGDEDHP